jgi:UDP-N-acetylmuramate: L-alanyl-gamma-D-glutamyl-meso-diaminopimelate ligase
MSKNAHVIGIAGIGMSAVALLLKEAGWHVTGSDQKIHPPSSEILPANGLVVLEPYKAENVPADVQLFVAGKSAAVTEENPELQVARVRENAGEARVESYAEVLGGLAKGRRNWVVAGSFGKSTTTAMLAWALRGAGVECGYFIGAQAKNFDLHARLGMHDVFVMEGDEYPSSHADNRAKFMHYNAEAVLLTSAQHDHINIYPTHEDFLRPFRDLIAGLAERNGLLVACADDSAAAKLAKEAKGRVVTYGVEKKADYGATEIVWGEVTTFTLTKQGQPLAKLSTTQLGLHNIQNMVGAAVMVLEQGLLTAEQVAESLSRFAGVRRRMEKLNAAGSVPVYEGFGSSREKSMSAIAAMKQHFADRRLVVVFEPHAFSWRNREMLRWYDDTFLLADELWVYPPPTHIGAGTHAQINPDELEARLRAAGKQPHMLVLGDVDGNVKAITGALKPDDVVLLLTSGSFGGMQNVLVKAIEAL